MFLGKKYRFRKKNKKYLNFQIFSAKNQQIGAIFSKIAKFGDSPSATAPAPELAHHNQNK